MVLGLNPAWFLWLPLVTGAADIDMDSSCSRTMDSDMVLSSISGSNVIMASVAAQVTLLSMVSSDLSKALTHQYVSGS